MIIWCISRYWKFFYGSVNYIERISSFESYFYAFFLNMRPLLSITINRKTTIYGPNIAYTLAEDNKKNIPDSVCSDFRPSDDFCFLFPTLSSLLRCYFFLNLRR